MRKEEIYIKNGPLGRRVMAEPKKVKGKEGYAIAHDDGRKTWLKKESFEARFTKA